MSEGNLVFGGINKRLLLPKRQNSAENEIMHVRAPSLSLRTAKGLLDVVDSRSRISG